MNEELEKLLILINSFGVFLTTSLAAIGVIALVGYCIYEGFK